MSLEGKQITVARDDVHGGSGHRTSDDLVVIRVAENHRRDVGRLDDGGECRVAGDQIARLNLRGN